MTIHHPVVEVTMPMFGSFRVRRWLISSPLGRSAGGLIPMERVYLYILRAGDVSANRVVIREAAHEDVLFHTQHHKFVYAPYCERK